MAEEPTEDQIERSQQLLRAVLGPMCWFCGMDRGLTQLHDGCLTEYVCVACVTVPASFNSVTPD